VIHAWKTRKKGKRSDKKKTVGINVGEEAISTRQGGRKKQKLGDDQWPRSEQRKTGPKRLATGPRRLSLDMGGGSS